MCNRKIKIRNKAFMGTKKNNYRPPELWNKELEYIEVPCGKCFECRKAKAREWKVRMYNERIERRSATFFTGTLTDKRLDYLANKYNINRNDINQLAKKETRLFLERIRKKNKTVKIKHWIVTEKGHTRTERIHIHGIFFTDNLDTWKLNNLLYKNWIAGYSFYGKYVSLKTINYVVKYLTKDDKDHPDFKGIILCSAGLGKNYLNERVRQVHRFNHEHTNRSYTLPNGTKIALPKYYTDKLYTDKERQILTVINKLKGYEYVRGEKLPNITDKDKTIIMIKKDEYNKWDEKAHGDNPELWREQKFKKRTGQDYYYRKRKIKEKPEIKCKEWDIIEKNIREKKNNIFDEITAYARYNNSAPF